jgi:hypothetical protein
VIYFFIFLLFINVSISPKSIYATHTTKILEIFELMFIMQECYDETNIEQKPIKILFQKKKNPIYHLRTYIYIISVQVQIIKNYSELELKYTSTR